MSDNDYDKMLYEIRRLRRVCHAKDEMLGIAITSLKLLANTETISEPLRSELSELSKSLEESLG